MMRLVLAIALALSLAGCGVKSGLTRPNDKATERGQVDPSRPPEPLGQ